MKTLLTLMAAALPVLLIQSVAKADGNSFDDSAAVTDGAVPDATPNQASDATFDKRLPPVLPGEQVSDSGRKMKVWSTSGPVPVASAPPEPYQENQIRNTERVLGGGGVVVDQRR